MTKRDERLSEQLNALGGFIRGQRQRARLSLRDLAARTKISNAYLSQIERGLHEPSVSVLKAVAGALGLSAEVLLGQAGLLERATAEGEDVRGVEVAIAADDLLTAEQKDALLAVYRSYLARNA